ncbi:hypothetical protein I316_03705 [Kwoniella heveanensis BCC8398]|uniref:C2H2-type domain-containing protein n=1 Tax=Kwoniella heveanensis BCC8398 TaxID=1296120 RepID=A0A1B9GUC1_9TREE|nr:hypothetical protein I316_03705 [Kwoniella heveanensis BCC8398]
MPGVEADRPEAAGRHQFVVDDQEFDESAPLQTKSRFATRTAEDVRASITEQLERRLDIAAVYNQTVAVSTTARRVHMYKKFNETRIALGISSGFSWSTWTRIAKRVLLELTEASKKVKKDNNGQEQVTYFRASNLSAHKAALQIVVPMDAPHAPRAEDVKAFEDDLEKYAQAICEEYGLNAESREKLSIGSVEIALLIQKLLKEGIDADVAVQFATFLVALLHSGGRPSTFIPTDRTKFFLIWRDIEIKPRRIGGKTVGFDVRLCLRSFKGASLGSSTSKPGKPIYIFISTVKSEANLIFDMGSWFVAHGLRQGVFGPGKTLDDLYRDQRRVLAYAPGFASRPVFYRTAARGYGLDLNGVMSYSSARDAFNRLARAVYLPRSEGHILGLSSIRRGTATRFIKAFGYDRARLLLGHSPNSTVLERFYDTSRDTMDAGAAITGEERSDDQGDIQGDAEDNPFTRCIHGSRKVRVAQKTRFNAIKLRYARFQDQEFWETSAEATYATVVANAAKVEDIKKGLPEELISSLLKKCQQELQAANGNGVSDELVLDDVDLADEDTDNLVSDDVALKEAKEQAERILASSTSAEKGMLAIQERKRLWIQSLITEVPSSSWDARTGLTCTACADDPETPKDKIGLVYLPSDLEDHLNWFHMPAERLKRFLGIRGEERVQCCSCDKDFSNASAIHYHLMAAHSDQAGESIPMEHIRTMYEFLSKSTAKKNRDLVAKINMFDLSMAKFFEDCSTRKRGLEDIDVTTGDERQAKRRILGTVTREGYPHLIAAANASA